jgi:hypothetical protein
MQILTRILSPLVPYCIQNGFWRRAEPGSPRASEAQVLQKSAGISTFHIAKTA